jgi:HTH-type transcriptional regulator/antitoxin HigA
MTATVTDRYSIHLPAPKIIRSEAQHDQYVSTLLKLESRKNLTAEQKSYAELLTVLISSYEEEHHPIQAASPIEVLQELLDANDLKQKDLAPLLGSESIVSEVLSGKRRLTRDHIERLSERFRVSPAVFFANQVSARR